MRYVVLTGRNFIGGNGDIGPGLSIEESSSDSQYGEVVTSKSTG
jgi:hypothetical protein